MGDLLDGIGLERKSDTTAIPEMLSEPSGIIPLSMPSMNGDDQPEKESERKEAAFLLAAIEHHFSKLVALGYPVGIDATNSGSFAIIIGVGFARLGLSAEQDWLIDGERVADVAWALGGGK